MRFFFSKTKFVSVCNTCNKYAWLDKNHPDDKKPIDEYTEVLFENGHKVGDLAKEYFKIDVDVAVLDENGKPNLSSMLEETKKALSSDARVIAEASFEYDGLFCSVDILVKNDDGSYEARHYIMLNERRVYYPKAICEAYANEAKELSWIDREENGYFVTVPKSVLEIKEEGDYQHHCVYTNGYVNDVIAHESVIVFLRKEKEIPLVTIEFDYNTFEVLQARGRYNQTPDYKARQYIKLLSETLNREKTSRE